MALSPASIRNVMSDLEQLGLIISPHTSAGRLPTQLGLRLFVDGLLEVGDVSLEERRQIETQIAYRRDKSVDQLLSEAGEMISGLSHCAGVVLAEKQVARLRHIEFVPLEPGRGLVDPRRRRSERRKPHHRASRRPAAVGAAGSFELSQHPSPRHDARRSQRRIREIARAPPRPNSTS